jgi:nucleoid-associated protein YgaU
MNIRTDLKAGDACYTVKSGDSLSTIAYSFYGSASQNNINKIYFSNMATIGPNPSMIHPGQKLYIPD